MEAAAALAAGRGLFALLVAAFCVTNHPLAAIVLGLCAGAIVVWTARIGADVCTVPPGPCRGASLRFLLLAAVREFGLDVPIVVFGAGVDRETVRTAVETTQIAPTILSPLGLAPHRLDAVRAEHTHVLPGL